MTGAYRTAAFFRGKEPGTSKQQRLNCIRGFIAVLHPKHTAGKVNWQGRLVLRGI